jgi:putative DNA primase/helicase
VHTPFLRADGSLCEQPGYDPASGLLFKPDRESFPPVPREPSKDDALAALATLEQLLATFPFVGEADRAVALSAILTALDRRAMATAPLHAFTSPTAGTGKSLLVDMVATLAIGQLMPVISQGRTEEELEKRLGAALLAGDVVISLDNCEHRLESTFLCQALTQEKLNIRMLGLSRNVETPVNATIFATGNNLTIAGDLIRRTLLCSLDAHCERPELRTFDVDAIKTARAERGRLVAAALTVLRAWQIARERETLSLPPFGSFEQWSCRIREPLVWLGGADPCSTIVRVRDSDPAREALWAVVMQWDQHLGHEQAYTIQEVIKLAAPEADFQAALVAVAASRTGLLVSNDRLGRWLKKVQGKIVNGFCLSQAGNPRGYPLWKLNRT